MDVLGKGWYGQTLATQYKLSAYDREIMSYYPSSYTRASVQRWLDTHAGGDFQSIKDFSASLDELEIPWTDEENECVFLDIMYPCDSDGDGE